MLFSSLFFIFVFLPLTMFFYYISKPKIANLLLLASSLFFYAWGEPVYVYLMIASIVLNYLFAIWIDKSEKHRLKVLWFAVLANLLILGYYKYSGFLAEILLSTFKWDLQLEPVNLPIGISFFTFNAISYIVDVYRKKFEANKNIVDIALFISLFPQLIAGPIVRYNEIQHQLRERTQTVDKFYEGLKRFIMGLAKKVIISNQLALLADTIFAKQPTEMSVSVLWIGIIAYSLQIYFDFSGYSDMAVGLGKMFGFDFPENFNYPYVSRSISEFWRRWHMSLGNWFKDYLYIPLGGNKVSTWKVYRNILIVWTATGFWHGASWTFMAWGFYYGVIIALEKAFLGNLLQKTWRPLQHLYVVMLFMIGWVFFRADNFELSFQYIYHMFDIWNGNIIDEETILYLFKYKFYLLIGIVLATPIYKVFDEKTKESKIFEIMKILLMVVLFAWVVFNLASSSYNPFIYFRF